MKLERWGKTEKDDWKAFVDEADYTTIFHTWPWLSTMQKHGAGDLHLLVGKKGEHAVAAIPLFVQKRMGFTLLFSPPPHYATPYLGPIFAGYEKLRQSRRERLYLDFHKLINTYIKTEIKPAYEFISTPPGLIDIRPWQWEGYQAVAMFDYCIRLDTGLEPIWQSLHRKVRQQIKQARQSNESIRVGTKKDFLALIDDVRKRYSQQGMRVAENDAFFSNLYDVLSADNRRILVADRDGTMVGGTIDLVFRNRQWGWIGGVKSTGRSSFMNAFIQWESIKRAAERGVTTYLEMGANTRHLCSYKRKFDAVVNRYFQVKRYPNPLFNAIETLYVDVVKPLHARHLSRSVR